MLHAEELHVLYGSPNSLGTLSWAGQIARMLEVNTFNVLTRRIVGTRCLGRPDVDGSINIRNRID